MYTYIRNFIMFYISLLVRNNTIQKDYMDTKALHLKWHIPKKKQNLMNKSFT